MSSENSQALQRIRADVTEIAEEFARVSEILINVSEMMLDADKNSKYYHLVLMLSSKVSLLESDLHRAIEGKELIYMADPRCLGRTRETAPVSIQRAQA